MIRKNEIATSATPMAGAMPTCPLTGHTWSLCARARTRAGIRKLNIGIKSVLASSLTAKMTAKLADDGELWQATRESCISLRISGEHLRTTTDAKPAVFKTVCGLRNSKVCGLASRVFY
jgi:hypothetical protein